MLIWDILRFFFFHRATVKKGVTFRTATPSNSLLWDITLDMGADGAIAVICQRKAPIPGKRQVCSNHIYISPLYARVFYLCVSILGSLLHICRLQLVLFKWTNNTPKVQREFFKWHYCNNVCPAKHICICLSTCGVKEKPSVQHTSDNGLLCCVLGGHLLNSVSTGWLQVLL